MRPLSCSLAWLEGPSVWLRIRGPMIGQHVGSIRETLREIEKAAGLASAYLDLGEVSSIDTAGLEALRSAIPAGVRTSLIEPREVLWAPALIERAFPRAGVYSSARELCAAIGAAGHAIAVRRFPRLRMHLPARVQWRGPGQRRETCDGWITDLSLGGARLTELRRGGRLFPARSLEGAEMVLSLGGSRRLRATAVRIAAEQRPIGLGLKFAEQPSA